MDSGFGSGSGVRSVGGGLALLDSGDVGHGVLGV
jgi:hypothetical protein